MAVMKKIYLIILLLFPTLVTFAQSGNEVNLNLENNELNSRFDNRKEKGFYNIMQFSLLFGSNQLTDRTSYFMPNNSNSSTIVTPDPRYYHSNMRTTFSVAPSFTLTNGYIFNEHWAAGAGLGFEIFDYKLFPLFAELRYTLWDHKISPFMVIKGGYSFASFKARHYDELYLNWSPYFTADTELRQYGGLMVHPEIGVKVPLSENSDLLFTAAYRYQKTKSIARKEFDKDQFDEWDHNEDINRLSFGIAVMFR
jgi:hypothetical protein